MKKILTHKKDLFGINYKILSNYPADCLKINYTSKMNFSVQQSVSKQNDASIQKQILEVKKNYDNLLKKFNIKPIEKTNLKALNRVNVENSDLSLRDIKKKYLVNSNVDDKDKFESIIKKIFKEEVLGSKKGKDYDDLIIFIKNCFKYNLKIYLTDPRYFRNKEIRKKVINSELMEKVHQERSPFAYQKEFQKKMNASNYYKILKNEKNEKEDYLSSKEYESEKYKYMNFLAESSSYKKLTNNIENKTHNENVINEFLDSEHKLENITSDLNIDKEVSENFYIDFLMKMKEKEREQSMGISEMDDKLFAKRLAENKDEILQNKNVNTHFEKEIKDDQPTTSRDETHFNIHTDNIVEENSATFLQNGIDTPYPYYGQADYPYDEFFSDEYMRGTTYMVSTLRDHGLLPVHPPKIDVISDFMHIDAMRWNYFTMIPNMRNHLKKYMELIRNIRNNKEIGKSGNKTFSFTHQSLVPYYNLLPKWAHEHPSIQNIVRGLEYHQHSYSFQQKITALNIALPLLLPLDDKLSDVAKDLYGYFRTNPSLANIDQLFEHNEDESRKSVFLPDDDFTDDKEEFYTFYTAADIRAIEKEEEEERKLKKREEGRAKRAAEEAKAAAESGDKKKEDKKDAKDEKKKGNEAQTEENVEEEKEEESEQEEEQLNDQGGVFDLKDDQEAEEELAMKGKMPKLRTEIKVKEENKYITQRKEALKLIDIKKEQDKLFADFLKKHNFELNDNFINITRDIIDVQTGKINLSKINFKEIPLSRLIINKFINEFGLNNEQTAEFLDIIKRNPNNEIRVTMGKSEKEEYLIFENDPKEKQKSKTQEKMNEEEDEEMGELTDLYRKSLRETEIKIDNEDDKGLKDVYYKPIHEVDFHLKTVYLPMDFYDNDDGFYDDYLKDLHSKIDISQYNTKPFILKRRRIKHISEIEI